MGAHIRMRAHPGWGYRILCQCCSREDAGQAQVFVLNMPIIYPNNPNHKPITMYLGTVAAIPFDLLRKKWDLFLQQLSQEV